MLRSNSDALVLLEPLALALSRNPFPLVIPCHRCIRSDGSVGGFRLPGLKGRLLELEGHRIEDGRVSAYGRGRPGINAGTCPD